MGVCGARLSNFFLFDSGVPGNPLATRPLDRLVIIFICGSCVLSCTGKTTSLYQQYVGKSHLLFTVGTVKVRAFVQPGKM